MIIWIKLLDKEVVAGFRLLNSEIGNDRSSSGSRYG